jgi:hypothetical protein
MAQNATPNFPHPLSQLVAEDLRDIASTLNRLRDDASPAHCVALDHLIDRMVQNANTIDRRVEA